jgi:hypothetical protein
MKRLGRDRPQAGLAIKHKPIRDGNTGRRKIDDAEIIQKIVIRPSAEKKSTDTDSRGIGAIGRTHFTNKINGTRKQTNARNLGHKDEGETHKYGNERRRFRKI